MYVNILAMRDKPKCTVSTPFRSPWYASLLVTSLPNAQRFACSRFTANGYFSNKQQAIHKGLMYKVGPNNERMGSIKVFI